MGPSPLVLNPKSPGLCLRKNHVPKPQPAVNIKRNAKQSTITRRIIDHALPEGDGKLTISPRCSHEQHRLTASIKCITINKIIITITASSTLITTIKMSKPKPQTKPNKTKHSTQLTTKREEPYPPYPPYPFQKNDQNDQNQNQNQNQIRNSTLSQPLVDTQKPTSPNPYGVSLRHSNLRMRKCFRTSIPCCPSASFPSPRQRQLHHSLSLVSTARLASY